MGSCALASHDYITREGEYGSDGSLEGDGSEEDSQARQAERDPAVYIESGHLPAWAEGHAREFWDAGDLYERANGRLYISADFAIPRDLDSEDQVALAHA